MTVQTHMHGAIEVLGHVADCATCTTLDEPDVQFCSFCSEPFPMDDPMVDYDGQTFCSPDCVREMLNNDDPCDHAKYVAAVGNFNALLGRVLAKDDADG